MLKAGWGNELIDWECRLSQLIATMYAVQNPQSVAKLGEPKVLYAFVSRETMNALR